MVTRIQKHLVEKHNMTPDTWRLDNPVAEHLRDHDIGGFQHEVDDLYLDVDESEDTSDPEQEVEYDAARFTA